MYGVKKYVCLRHLLSVGDIQANIESTDDEFKRETVTDLDTSSESEFLNALNDLDPMLQQSQDEEEIVQEQKTGPQQSASEHTVPEGPVLPEKRVRKQPQRYGYSNLCTLGNSENSTDPVTIQEALASPDRDMWIKAMQDEMQAFKDNEAWTPVNALPSDKTLVQCKHRRRSVSVETRPGS
ncbi:hypothetical protein HF086_006463 [Spodoptera exigua]|uniref:Gag-pol polyprotein n=1 Tax=Spodoptera exigua TaxID=7107 RepID=A0A922SP08_SPOEX|nr:hypothetical protein HF086_006463 [Spodoptera exigua]